MSIPRKSLLGEPVSDTELDELLRNLPDEELSEEQLGKQRASFILGNSPENATVTRESAQHAAEHILI